MKGWFNNLMCFSLGAICALGVTVAMVDPGPLGLVVVLGSIATLYIITFEDSL